MVDEDFFYCCHVYIDDLTNCLVDNETGEEVRTYVELIEDWSVLEDYTKENGWHADWQDWDSETELYALYVEGDDRIQGLLSIVNLDERDSAYIQWVVAAPHNNPEYVGKNGKEYNGVGGHLFAVAAACSLNWGHHGGITGRAASAAVLNHYIEEFNAVTLAAPDGKSPYYFVVPNPFGQWLVDTYTLDF